jgi:hypothetical protein
MKSVARALKWLLPGCVAIGLVASAQVTYQINGTGSDGSKMTGTVVVTPASGSSGQGPATSQPTPVMMGLAAVYNAASHEYIGAFSTGSSSASIVAGEYLVNETLNGGVVKSAVVTGPNPSPVPTGVAWNPSGASLGTATITDYKGDVYGTTGLYAGTALPGATPASGQLFLIDSGAGVEGLFTFPGATTQPAGPAVTPTTGPSPVIQQSLLNPTPPAPNGTESGASITVTNQPGLPIYPLDGVFVTCTHTPSGQGGTLTPVQLFMAAINPNGGIFWNFGDPGGEGNLMKGFNAAHSYATAGQKTITLTIVPMNLALNNGVVTLSNGPSYIATTTVNVATDNRPVVHILPGAAIPEMVSDNVYEFDAASGGTTWNFAGAPAFDVSAQANVLVKTNGNPATIFCTSPTSTNNFIGFNSSSAGITINGLTFNYNPSQASGTDVAIIQPQGSGGLTLLNDVFLNYGEGIYDQLAASNVLAMNVSSPTPLGAKNYFCWWVGTDLTLYDCYVNGSQQQWEIRTDPQPAVLTDVNISCSTISTLAESPGKGAVRYMTGQFMTLYGNTLEGNAGPNFQADPSLATTPLGEYYDIDSNTLIGGGSITLKPSGGTSAGGILNYVGIVNNAITGIQSGQQGIWSQSTSGPTSTQSNLYVLNNTLVTVAGAAQVPLIMLPTPATQGVTIANNWLDASGDTPFINIGQTNTGFITAISNNLWPTGATAIVNGQSLTPTQWEQQALGGGPGASSPGPGGSPTGDVYANPSLGGTYSVTQNGQTFGSDLSAASKGN